MFRNPERLAALAARTSVRVAETPFAELLIAHESEGTSAILLSRRGPVEKRVVLERGIPVDCRSNLLHETLSRYLSEIGRISADVAAAALARSAERGVLVGQVLVEEGHLDSTELTRVLQMNLAKKLLDLFTWADGEIQLVEEKSPPQSALKLKLSQLVLTGVSRFMPQAAIDRRLAPLGARLFERDPEAAAKAAELRMSPREATVIERLDASIRLDDLVGRSGIPPADAARSIYALLLLGLIAPAGTTFVKTVGKPLQATPIASAAPDSPASAGFGVSGQEDPRPLRVPETGVGVGPGSGATPADLSRIRNQVSEAFLAHRQKDAFELLGVADETSRDEIEARYLAFAERFAPWSFAAPELESVAEAARELYLAGAVAYARLVDPVAAQELRTRRRLGREEAERSSRASFHRIETDLLDPAVQHRKGLALLEAGKLKAALEQLEFAADCDPQNGDYRAEAARCRYRLLPSAEGRAALEELEEAQRVDPKSVRARLYFGEIAGEMGRFDEAEASLRQAARILGPNDRRALDALHVLSALRRQKR